MVAQLCTVNTSPNKSNSHVAGAFAGNGQVVAMLLVRGANINVQNKLGLSAHQEMRGEAITTYKYFSQGIQYTEAGIISFALGDMKSLSEAWPIVNVLQTREGWKNITQDTKNRKRASSKVRHENSSRLLSREV